MPSPAFTVTGNLQDIFGVSVPNGTITFTLSRYLTSLPRVAGTAMLVTPSITVTANASGAFSATLWGNDVITPAGTSYQVTFKNSAGLKLGISDYTFNGSGSFDISNLTPNNTPPIVVTVVPNVVVTNPSSQQKINSFPLELATSLILDGATSGNTVLQASAAASGTLTLPAVTDFLATRSSAESLSNKTFVGDTVSNGGLTFLGASSGATLLAGAVNAGGTLNLPNATDTLVGKTTTDIFKNKNLTSASNGNVVTLLNRQDPSAIITGTSSPVTLYSYTLPANTLAAGKGLRVTVQYQHTTGTASATIALSIGGSSVSSYPTTTNQTGNVVTRWSFTWWNKQGLTNSNLYEDQNIVESNALIFGPRSIATSIDTTVSQNIVFTFNVANTDQFTPMSFQVELIQ